jgi:hypothetical protein
MYLSKVGYLHNILYSITEMLIWIRKIQYCFDLVADNFASTTGVPSVVRQCCTPTLLANCIHHLQNHAG